MTRRARGIVAAALAVGALLPLAGCGDGIAGTGHQVPTPTADRRATASTVPSTSLRPTTAAPTTPTATPAGGGDGGSPGGSGGGGGTGSGAGGSGGGTGGGTATGSSTPAFRSASVACVVTGHESVPGRGEVPTYSPRITWTTVNATAVAVSVDNPGGVGTYGTFGASDSVELGDGCYADQNSHTVVLQTVGGTGSPVTRTLRTPATMTHPQPVTGPPSSASPGVATSASSGG